MEVKKNPKRMNAKNEKTELETSDELKDVSPSEPSQKLDTTSFFISMLIGGGILCVVTYMNWKPEPPANIMPKPEPQANAIPEPRPRAKTPEPEPVKRQKF